MRYVGVALLVASVVVFLGSPVFWRLHPELLAMCKFHEPWLVSIIAVSVGGIGARLLEQAKVRG